MSFAEFVKLFAIYGNQMVDLAHLTGDRQNVIEGKNERIDLFCFAFRILKMNVVDRNYRHRERS